MVATILLKLLLFLAVFELASAIAGHRVYGTRFSLALPRITTADGVVSTDTKYIGSLYMMTEEERSKVKIFYPVDAMKEGAGYDIKEHNLEYRLMSMEEFIPKIYSFPRNSRTGVYNTVKITSSSPIRVILNRYNNENQDSADSHNVMPAGSCSTSYYVSTGLGHAFLMVMTFDSTVNVNVSFASTKQPFQFHCHTDKPCKDGSTVLLTLGENKAWYVEQIKGVRFHNTLIQTDNPVFVIAGNKDLESTGDARDDLVVTSIYPTEAWGKEYITPRFTTIRGEKRNLVLQFNVKTLPFRFQTFDGVTMRNKIISNLDSYFTIANTHGPYVIRGNVPFGLYQIFGLEGQSKQKENCVATIVNLIPIEQWSNGVVFSALHHKRSKYIHIFFTTARRNRVFWTKPKINYVTWERKSLTYKGRNYNVGHLTLKALPATLYTLDPTARMMVYQFSFHRTSCSCQAVDFYQANIDKIHCKLTKIVAEDGVDNDCDGYVDEEIKDLKDNDGDGKMDEDNVSHGASNWAAWVDACYFECSKVNATLRVRSCNKPRFGKDCDGKDRHCPPLNLCQISCEDKPIVPTCRCQEGCQTCQKNTAVCPRCKAGYYDDQYCSRPCPKGWMGKGCSNEMIPKISKPGIASKPNSNSTKKENGKEKEKGNGKQIIKYIFIVLGVLIFLIIICCVVVKLCLRKKSPPVEDQVGEIKHVGEPVNEDGTSYATESRAETESMAPSTVESTVDSEYSEM